VLVAGKKRKNWILLGIAVFVVYFFIASKPVPEESVLAFRWITPLAASPAARPEPTGGTSDAGLIPFRIGRRFGYLNADGTYLLNREVQDQLALSETRWAEYDTLPESISVRSPEGQPVFTLAAPLGYPFFRDGRTFLISGESNALLALDDEGRLSWRYDFQAPITVADAAAGLVLIGGLDGSVELLDAAGRREFSFEPGGSRLPVIIGAAISADGSRLALVSGIDRQRFLLLERYGASFKVVYHEFLETGFRRPVFLAFIDDDRRVAFEREGALGIVDVAKRRSVTIPLPGRILGMEDDGSGARLYVISADKDQNVLLGIDYPDRIAIRAPFSGSTTFIARRGSRVYLGGDKAIAAFEQVGR